MDYFSGHLIHNQHHVAVRRFPNSARVSGTMDTVNTSRYTIVALLHVPATTEDPAAKRPTVLQLSAAMADDIEQRLAQRSLSSMRLDDAHPSAALRLGIDYDITGEPILRTIDA